MKPALAQNCWVLQGTSATFYCAIPLKGDVSAARAYHTELTDDVTASLPGDWSEDTVAPLIDGQLASTGYRSSSGAAGAVWLVAADSGGGYELRYRLVAAAAAPQAANPTDDDPIGEGGFITPPTPNKPPRGLY